MFKQTTVLFDLSVLYPAPIRDLIIELGCSGFYHAKWTEQIHEEWISSLLENRKDLSKKKISRTKELMNQAISDCLVEHYEDLIETVNLPDINDRHIVSAAIKSSCEWIVTYNLKDFPNRILQHFDITSINPDDFFLDQLDLKRPAFLHAIKEIRTRLKNPPLTQEEYLFTLQQARLFKTVEELEQYAEFI